MTLDYSDPQPPFQGVIDPGLSAWGFGTDGHTLPRPTPGYTPPPPRVAHGYLNTDITLSPINFDSGDPVTEPGNAIVPTPDQPGTFDPGTGSDFGGSTGQIPMPGGPTPPGTPQTPGQANPNAFFDGKQFLIWMAALAVLWFFLTMLADQGYGKLAYSLAALILGGAVMFMGKDAIANAQKLFA